MLVFQEKNLGSCMLQNILCVYLRSWLLESTQNWRASAAMEVKKGAMIYPSSSFYQD